MYEFKTIKKSLFITLFMSSFSNAGTSSGNVIFNGQVAETLQPTCEYSAINLNVTIPTVDVSKIPSTLVLENALKNMIVSGEIVPNNGESVKNAYQALGQGYASTSIDVTCKGLSQYFTVNTKNVTNDSTCSSVGCSYLAVQSSDMDVNKNFAISMFIFASIYGTGGISSGWVNPSVKGGFNSVLSLGGGFPLFYKEGTGSKTKNIKFSFVLVKRDGSAPSEWEKSKDSGEYSYNSSVVMQFIYQ